MRALVSFGVLGLVLGGCQEYDVQGKPPEVELPPEDTDAPPPPPPGTPQPDILIDPPMLTFGGYPANCPSGPATVTVTNVGDADLSVNDIFFASATAAFTHNGGPLTLTPGASTQFQVDFTPGAVQVYEAEILIASNDPDEAVAGVPVLGEGLPGNLIQEGFNQIGQPAVPTDILFVIDNSDSMFDDVNALRNNFDLFMQGFITLGLDYQIGVVTTDMENPAESGRLQGPIITTATPDPVAQFSANANVGINGSITEQGLAAAHAALSSPLIDNENYGLVRPGSLLSVIVISDEPDQSSITAPEMITFLDTYQGNPDLSSLSIVGGPKNGILPCFRGIFPAAPVPKYWNVARNTGGIHVNICNLDMALIVQQLAVIAAGLDTAFELANVPGNPASIEVAVDGVVIPQDPNNGWVYDAATNTIYMNGTSLPQAGSYMTVTYPGAGVCP